MTNVTKKRIIRLFIIVLQLSSSKMDSFISLIFAKVYLIGKKIEFSLSHHFFRFTVELRINSGDLVDPSLTLAVLQVHDLVIGPVEVVSNVGYLLEQAVRRVAYSSPDPLTSTSNSASHSGQVIPMCAVPSSFTRR